MDWSVFIVVIAVGFCIIAFLAFLLKVGEHIADRIGAGWATVFALMSVVTVLAVIAGFEA